MHHDDINMCVIGLGCKILLTQNQHLLFCTFLFKYCNVTINVNFFTQSFKYAYTWCLRVDTQ